MTREQRDFLRKQIDARARERLGVRLGELYPRGARPTGARLAKTPRRAKS